MEDESDTFKKLWSISWPFLIIIFLLNILEWLSIYISIFLSDYLNINLSTIGIILSIGILIKAVFEIPTWLLGEIIWNKKNIILWIITLTLWFLLISLWTVYSVIIGIILLWIWDTLRISSLNASAIDTIKSTWYKDLSNFFSLKTFIIALWYLTGLSISYTLIDVTNNNLNLLFGIGCIISLLSLLPAIAFIKNSQRFLLSKSKKESPLSVTTNILKILLKNNKLKYLLIITLLGSILIEWINNFVYIIFKEIYNTSQSITSIIGFLEMITGLLLPIILLKLNWKIYSFKEQLIIYSLILIGILLIIISYTTNINLGLLFLSLFYLSSNIYYIFRETILHETISTYRTTTDSIFNLIENVWESIWSLLFGLVLNILWFIHGLQLIWSISILLIFTILLINLLLEKRKIILSNQ